jgi:23S rRNA pseudouridine1911/1915/1917 synthase
VTPTPIVIRPSEAGRTLAAIIKSRLGMTWTAARAAIAAGHVRIDSQPCRDSVRRMKRNERVEIVSETGNRKSKKRRPPSAKPKPLRRSSALRGSIPIVYADDAIVVVDKPAGLTTMRHATEAAEFGSRGRRYLPPTLQDRLAVQFPGGSLRAVHRIDRDTSGLVVFARTPDVERRLGNQFRAHTVTRRYLAIVRGLPPEGKIESWFVADRGDGRRGSGPAGTGQRAVTHVRVLESLGDCSLIECRLETGRTHQVRIHLGEAGAPLAGETLYDRPLHGSPAPDLSGAPRIALHAASLGFIHPVTEQPMDWESPLPDDLQCVLDRLRARTR